MLFFLLAAQLVFSPLLPNIERSLALSHTRTTSFFLFITLGYSVSIMVSEFVAARLTHRGTVALAVPVAAAALGLVSMSRSLPAIRVGL